MYLSGALCDISTKHNISLLYDKEKASVHYSVGKTSVELVLVCKFEKQKNLSKYFLSKYEH